MILFTPPERQFYVIPYSEFRGLVNAFEYVKFIKSSGQFMARQQIRKAYFVPYNVQYNERPALWKPEQRKDLITVMAMTREATNYRINTVFVFPRPLYNAIEASEIASDYWEDQHKPAGILATN